jgi:hypothetical protein
VAGAGYSLQETPEVHIPGFAGHFVGQLNSPRRSPTKVAFEHYIDSASMINVELFHTTCKASSRTAA